MGKSFTKLGWGEQGNTNRAEIKGQPEKSDDNGTITEKQFTEEVTKPKTLTHYETQHLKGKDELSKIIFHIFQIKILLLVFHFFFYLLHAAGIVK